MPAPVSFEGKVLGGRYRVGAALGSGGMGTVYEATQTDLGRRVAIKVLRPERSDDPVYLARFRREARAAAALGHPHIVQITDFQEGEPVFLVMELLEGKPLSALLKGDARLPVKRI